jgi:hypothetical protein
MGYYLQSTGYGTDVSQSYCKDNTSSNYCYRKISNTTSTWYSNSFSVLDALDQSIVLSGSPVFTQYPPQHPWSTNMYLANHLQYDTSAGAVTPYSSYFADDTFISYLQGAGSYSQNISYDFQEK